MSVVLRRFQAARGRGFVLFVHRLSPVAQQRFSVVIERLVEVHRLIGRFVVRRQNLVIGSCGSLGNHVLSSIPGKSLRLDLHVGIFDFHVSVEISLLVVLVQAVGRRCATCGPSAHPRSILIVNRHVFVLDAVVHV